MKKKNYARKGFTLVELLIVIVVIGILSAMMMLSSTEAMSSAKASNIVSNLRNLKTATLAWYADHVDWVDPNLQVLSKDIHEIVGTGENQANILKYFNNEGSIVFEGNAAANSGKYTIRSVQGTNNNSKVWYLGYVFAQNDTAVREKLAGRAKSLGLKFGNNAAANLSDEAGTSEAVWLKTLGN